MEELNSQSQKDLYSDLLEEAKKVSKNAYVPYSKFRVGAVVLFESGKRYHGCNVENASYGLTLCAERNAMSTAFSEGEKSKILMIAVYSPNQKRCMPCGACRQWFCELAKDENMKVILEGDDGNPLALTLEEVFPFGFKIEDKNIG